MKRYFYFFILFAAHCRASELQDSEKIHVSWKQKMTEAGKTLVKYGVPFTAYDFLKNYNTYYNKNKGQIFSYKKAFREVGKTTAKRAAKRTMFLYPALVLYQSAYLEMKAGREELSKQRKKELPKRLKNYQKD